MKRINGSRGHYRSPAAPPSLNLATLLIFLLLTGCSQLPGYALPQVHSSEGSWLTGLPYAKLTRSDFQAEFLPPGMQMHAGSLSARSSLQIRPCKDVKFVIHTNWYQGQQLYFGHVENLRFEAVLIPEKSWWNPKVPKEKEAYVLEHEQIHFGLLELAARRLTDEARASGDDFFVIQSSYAGARDALLKEMQDLIRSTTLAQFEEHKRFDEETSQFYDPPVQRRWLERIEAKLAE